jgi:hypothetical protein
MEGKDKPEQRPSLTSSESLEKEREQVFIMLNEDGIMAYLQRFTLDISNEARALLDGHLAIERPGVNSEVHVHTLTRHFALRIKQVRLNIGIPIELEGQKEVTRATQTEEE